VKTMAYLLPLYLTATTLLAHETQVIPNTIKSLVCSNQIQLSIHRSPEKQSSKVVTSDNVNTEFNDHEIHLFTQQKANNLDSTAHLELGHDSLELKCHDSCQVNISDLDTQLDLNMADSCQVYLDGAIRVNHIRQRHRSALRGQWIHSPSLQLTSKNASTTKLLGFIERATFDISDNAIVDMSGAEINKAWIKAVESAKIGLRPIDQLFAYGDDSSSVYYFNRLKLQHIQADSNSDIIWVNPKWINQVSFQK